MKLEKGADTVLYVVVSFTAPNGSLSLNLPPSATGLILSQLKRQETLISVQTLLRMKELEGKNRKESN